MINPLPGIIVGYLVVRRLRRKPGEVTQGQRNPLIYLAPIAWMLTALALSPLALTTAWQASTVLGIIVTAVLLPLLFPWAFTRTVLIPLGRPRLARFFTAWLGVAFSRDRVGGPSAAGTWALLRRKQHDTPWEQAEAARFAKAPLRAGGILAHGLLAASRGDLDSASSLLDSVSRLDARVCPTKARRMACQWLALDAAERGDWPAVRDMFRPRGRTRRRTTTALERLMKGLAARALGEPYPAATLRLVTAWLFSFRWIAAWPLLRRGLGPRPAQPSLSIAVDLSDPLTAAVTLHTHVLRTPSRALSADRVVAAGLAWDEAFAGARLAARLQARATSLALIGAPDSVGSLRGSVVSDLAQALRASTITQEQLRNAGEIVTAAAAQVRDERLTAVEDAARRLRARVKEERKLDPIDEWREFLLVCQAHEEAARFGGLEARRLAFAETYHTVSSQLVWLYNKRDEKAIAHAMICWLLGEATAVGNTDAIEMQTKNAKLGPGVR